MSAYFTFDDTLVSLLSLVSLVSFLAVAFVCIFPHILHHWSDEAYEFKDTFWSCSFLYNWNAQFLFIWLYFSDCLLSPQVVESQLCLLRFHLIFSWMLSESESDDTAQHVSSWHHSHFLFYEEVICIFYIVFFFFTPCSSVLHCL